MADLIGIILNLAVPAILLLAGWSIGYITEKRHLARLDEAEHALADVAVHDLKSFPGISGAGAEIVIAETVIAADYFKSFVARIRNILGGELRSYRSLVERTRRQAVVRLREQARSAGYSAVANIRLECPSISLDKTGKGAVMVSVLAWGTAYHAQTSGS